MDDFSLEKLAKEIVVERLKGVEDAPSGAGAIARKIVAAAVTGTRARQSPRDSVHAVCRGLMSGMVILEKDLPATAVAILRQMDAVAHDADQDPADLMTWAMEGIAPVARLAGAQACGEIQGAIETAFMGAGQVFSSVCDAAASQP